MNAVCFCWSRRRLLSRPPNKRAPLLRDFGRKIRTARAITWLWVCSASGEPIDKELRQNTRAALRLNSSSADAHAALGTLHWSRNELEAADAELRKASELAPPYSPLRLRYAEFKRRTGAGEDGAALLRKLSDQYPDYLPPGVALMNLACAKGRDDQCAARVKNVLGQDPRNVDAVFQNGLLKLSQRMMRRMPLCPLST